VIADDGIQLGPTSLAQERRELLAAIDLVATGVASRVIVAGLAHARELVTRMNPRASVAGVLLQRLPAEGPRSSVLVRVRPSVLEA
jgi:hypothetical protein